MALIEDLQHPGPYDDETFSSLVRRAVEEGIIDDLVVALRFSTPKSQVHRWAAGEELPDARRRPLVISFIRAMAEQ